MLLFVVRVLLVVFWVLVFIFWRLVFVFWVAVGGVTATYLLCVLGTISVATIGSPCAMVKSFMAS